MSKNDNKELNAILARLKKSYSDNDNIENSKSNDSEDDFQKMLSNYFSDGDSDKDIYKFTVSKNPDEENITAGSDYSLADFEEFTVEDEPEIEEVIEDEIVEDEPEIKEIIEDEIIEDEPEIEEVIEDEIVEDEPEIEEIIEGEIVEDEYDDKERLDDKAIVDDVFAAMFPSANSVKTPIEELGLDINDKSAEQNPHTEHISRMLDLHDTDEDYQESPVVDMPSESDEYAFLAEDVVIVESDTDSELVDESAISKDGTDKAAQFEAFAQNEKSDQDKQTIDDIIGEMEVDEQEEITLDVSAILVKSSESESEDTTEDLTEDAEMSEAEEQIYYSDPLQGHLSDAAFVSYKIADDDVNFDVGDEASELDDEEISLLLDFGYDDEAEAEAGRERTNEIKRRGKIALSANSRIYGYCGEEYSHKTQNSQIKDKYARDKKELLIKSAVVLSLLLILFFMSMVNCFGASVNHLLYSFVEMIALGVISVIGLSGLKKGIVGLFKLEPNLNSAPAIVVIITLLYDIFSIIYVGVTSDTLFDGVLLPCGFFAAMYVFAMILSEYLECLAESNAFEVLSDSSKLYTAEKVNKNKDDEINSFDDPIVSKLSGESVENQTFEVRKTSIPNGYFGRMSQKQIRLPGSFYLWGVIFVVSLIMGCVALIKEGSIATAAYSSVVIILTSMPVSFALIKSLPKISSSIALKQKNCAIVGDGSSEEYACTDTLIFDDECAIEIVDRIEIRPEANSDIASAMKIAARALKALGGPISTIVKGSFADSPSEKQPTISVLSLRDNGIEFYMDSSVYMLIGDAAFMSTFGIRVSSDCDAYVSSDSSRYNNVIYVAIDGVPRLGYIVNSKISDTFAALVTELDKYGIKSAVASFDPTVNDYYFEQNKIIGASTVSAYKPQRFYNRQADAVADGGIFACDDAKNIIHPLIEARKLHNAKKMNRVINYIASILGCAVSVIYVIFALLGNTGRNLNFTTLALIFLIQMASALTVIFNSFDFKRKRDKT